MTESDDPSKGFLSQFDDNTYHIQNRTRPGDFNRWFNSWFCGSEEEAPKLSRLLDRDAPFSQSNGRMNIRKKILKNEWRALYGADLFHSLVDAPTYKCIALLLFS